MITVLVNGCNGRMGQELVKEIDSFDELVLFGGFDLYDKGINTYPVYSNFEKIHDLPDIIVDFSVPVATLSMLEFARSKKIPMVIATTGFSKEELVKIRETAQEIPIFQSSNMSFDINLMKKIVSQVACCLKDNDIEIVETHHNRKIDSPSGTAILLADAITKALGVSKEYVFNRHEQHEKRNPNEIGFSSIRGGNIVGEHSVQFFGPYETFEIKHTSYSRNVFAQGALKAAIYLKGKQPGYYGMDDLLQN